MKNETYRTHLPLLLDVEPEPFFNREAWTTFTYHYVRLFKTLKKDVVRGCRKPAVGKRWIAPLTTEEKSFLRGDWK